MTPVVVHISAVDDTAADVLPELREWLRLDLPGIALEPVYRPTAPGEMNSGALQTLEAAVLSKEFLGMIVTGIGGWCTARATGRRATIRVKVGDNEVEIDASSAKDVEKLIQRLSAPANGSSAQG
jgi:hypothetical protein